MAGKTAVLAIKVVSDARGGAQGLQQTRAELKKTEDAVGKVGRAATGAAAVTEAGLLYMANAAKNAASELQQSAGAVESVYGNMADSVKASAKTAAKDVGLAQSDYLQMASVLGAQLKNMGVPMDRVAGQSQELIEKGADLAAMFGGTTADAVDALSSLLRGERDPIERYGVSIKQATIDAYKAANGLDGLTGSAAAAADTQATLALLTEQTAAAQGQFAREADSASGAAQRADAAWKDAQASLGEALLPLMVQLAGVASDVAANVSENPAAWQTFATVVGIAAGAILLVSGAVKAYEAAAIVATAAQWAWNIAMDANPIGLLIMAAGLLVAGIILIATHWDEASAATQQFAADFVAFIQPAIDAVAGFVGWIVDGVNAIGQLFASAPADWLADPGAMAHAMYAEVDYGDGPDQLAMVLGDSTTVAEWETYNRPSRFTSSSGRAAAAGDTYNVTVQGALDPVGVSRQIGRLLDGQRKRAGSTPAGGRGWAVA